MRLLHGDTCGSSSGARALRSPGAGTGRNQPRGPDGRRTLLYPSAVGHDSHGTPQTGPRAGIYSLCRPLYSTSGGSDMALILIFYFCLQARFPPLGDRGWRGRFLHNSHRRGRKMQPKTQGHPFMSTLWSTPRRYLKNNESNLKKMNGLGLPQHIYTRWDYNNKWSNLFQYLFGHYMTALENAPIWDEIRWSRQ